MITVRWRVVYIEGGVMKETCLTITGNTYNEVSPSYLEKLRAFGQILISEFVGYKEEEQLPQDLSLEGAK